MTTSGSILNLKNTEDPPLVVKMSNHDLLLAWRMVKMMIEDEKWQTPADMGHLMQVLEEIGKKHRKNLAPDNMDMFNVKMPFSYWQSTWLCFKIALDEEMVKPEVTSAVSAVFTNIAIALDSHIAAQLSPDELSSE